LGQVSAGKALATGGPAEADDVPGGAAGALVEGQPGHQLTPGAVEQDGLLGQPFEAAGAIDLAMDGLDLGHGAMVAPVDLAGGGRGGQAPRAVRQGDGDGQAVAGDHPPRRMQQVEVAFAAVDAGGVEGTLHPQRPPMAGMHQTSASAPPRQGDLESRVPSWCGVAKQLAVQSYHGCRPCNHRARYWPIAGGTRRGDVATIDPQAPPSPQCQRQPRRPSRPLHPPVRRTGGARVRVPERRDAAAVAGGHPGGLRPHGLRAPGGFRGTTGGAPAQPPEARPARTATGRPRGEPGGATATGVGRPAPAISREGIMSLAIIHSRSKQGIDAPAITIEVHLSNGLPSLSIVGMPETAVKESRERVRSALLNAHFDFPPRRITINLAPADIPKEGSRYDLAIALGILAASGQLPAEHLGDYEFVAELALNGELRAVDGLLPTAIACGRAGRKLVIADGNRDEAALAHHTTVLPARHLLEVCAHLRGAAPLDVQPGGVPDSPVEHHLDMADVIGQHQARRALEVAAAGGHNLLFSGPPGTGKTLLASRLPTIMPPLGEEDALEVASIY